jgi:hypothetical protein
VVDPLTKLAPSAPPAPLLAPWLAFLCAGVCSSMAGYLACTIGAWTEAYQAEGVELPWVTQVVVDAGRLLPLGLVLLAGGILALATLRSARPRVLELRPLVALLAVGSAGASGLFFWALVLAYVSVQKSLNH